MFYYNAKGASTEMWLCSERLSAQYEVHSFFVFFFTQHSLFTTYAFTAEAIYNKAKIHHVSCLFVVFL